MANKSPVGGDSMADVMPSPNTQRATALSPTQSPGLGNPRVAFVRHRTPVPTAVFETYWQFACERQAIFMRRLSGCPRPWTTDPILNTYKFTNAFRASDRTSQYLIQNVIYNSACSLIDVVFRTLLFKLFNKIQTWELLTETLGPIRYADFDWQHCDHVLTAAQAAGAGIYSPAYIMPTGQGVNGGRKHRMHLALLQRMMADQLPVRIKDARTMRKAYELLLAYPSIGPFLAYQFVIDLSYSDHFPFNEMEFVVPGPGARDGLKKCFRDLGDYSEQEVIRWVTENQNEEFAMRGLTACTLWGRPLHLIDCQNLFCEVDKYARVAHPDVIGHSKRTRIKQRFHAKPEHPVPWYPPKWGLNDTIAQSLATAKQNPVPPTHGGVLK
jgi:5-hmdU DNA kinase, helical domain